VVYFLLIFLYVDRTRQKSASVGDGYVLVENYPPINNFTFGVEKVLQIFLGDKRKNEFDFLKEYLNSFKQPFCSETWRTWKIRKKIFIQTCTLLQELIEHKLQFLKVDPKLILHLFYFFHGPNYNYRQCIFLVDNLTIV
jgi:hypothetical protein